MVPLNLRPSWYVVAVRLILLYEIDEEAAENFGGHAVLRGHALAVMDVHGIEKKCQLVGVGVAAPLDRIDSAT
jgi:hypothetical protein